jgi:hypothetical protein
MRVICAVFLVSSALSLAGVAIAEGQKRTAVVVDTAGQSTEVTDLQGRCDTARYDAQFHSEPLFDQCVVVETGTFEIAIDLQNLLSVVPTGKLSTAKYVFRGQVFSATGNLQLATLTGTSDFGHFEIRTGSIKRIEFKEAPTPAEAKEARESAVPATLSLVDGSLVPVTRLRRSIRYLGSAGYLGTGREMKTGTDESIEFMRGESKTTVAMQEIAKVDFGANDAVSVTLKNGKNATGTLGRDPYDYSMGFCGTFERGYFFIDKKHVKSIEFVGGAK